MKSCPSCKIQKSLVDFYKNIRTPDGVAYTCKSCMAEYSKLYRKQNKTKLAEVKKVWYEENKQHIQNYTSEYYKKNKEKVVKRVVAYRRNRLKTDIVFKLQKNIRHRLNKVLKQQSSKIAIDFLGCSLHELKSYLECKFQNGMTWDNYGSGDNKWNIDHVLPLSYFNLLDPVQLERACHFSNLQPMWSKDNLRKSDKVE